MYQKIVKNIDPFEFFLKTTGEKDVCFFYSYTNDGWAKNISMNAVDKFIYNGGSSDKFEADLEFFINKNLKCQHKICGFISYDIGYEIYGLKRKAKDDLKLPKILFMAFDNWIEIGNNSMKIVYRNKSFLNKVAEINLRKITRTVNPKSHNFKFETNKSTYNKAYKKIKKYIKNGDIYQINLTHRLKGETNLSAKELFVKVAQSNPVDFLAYLEGDNFEIISASPERFVKIKGRNIGTCPVKGTKPRGKDKQEDLKFKKDLIDSEKEAAELNMITDLLRNDLGKVCEIGSVKVEGSRLISVCPTVFHTYSKVVGKILKGMSSMKALLSMLPGGSITGCPKKRAMEVIDELEPNTRGLYTGIIGQMGPNDDFDFNIAIRTIIKKKENLFLQVGGGIVLDSKMDDEFNETLVKAKSFMNIL